MENKYMEIAIKEAEKAYKKQDVPVGCVIVKNDKIIARSYNKKHQKRRAIYHAEILAINKACKKLRKWRLDDCVLYVTLEPCDMCYSAAIESRIKKIVYLVKSNYNNNKLRNDKYQIKEDTELEVKYLQLLKEFFKQMR